MGSCGNLAGSLTLSSASGVLPALSDAAWLNLWLQPPSHPPSWYFFKVISAGTEQVICQGFFPKGSVGKELNKRELNKREGETK